MWEDVETALSALLCLMMLPRPERETGHHLCPLPPLRILAITWNPCPPIPRFFFSWSTWENLNTGFCLKKKKKKKVNISQTSLPGLDTDICKMTWNGRFHFLDFVFKGMWLMMAFLSGRGVLQLIRWVVVGGCVLQSLCTSLSSTILLMPDDIDQDSFEWGDCLQLCNLQYSLSFQKKLWLFCKCQRLYIVHQNLMKKM